MTRNTSTREDAVVREIQKEGKTFYVCELCGFTYQEEQWARKCQEWCSAHHSCNLEIIEHGSPPG